MGRPFASLPDDYFREGLIADLVSIQPDQELTIMNKIGGQKPFLTFDEHWPQNSKGEDLTFICQFQHPDKTKGQLARFFIDVNDVETYRFDIIDLNQPYQISLPPITCRCLPCHEIRAWRKRKELVDLESIFLYYIDHCGLFQLDFKKEIEEYELSQESNATTNLATDPHRRIIIHGILSSEYLFSTHKPLDATLKLDGVPYSDEGLSGQYLLEGTFMQLCSRAEIPFPFSVGHIMVDNLDFVCEVSD